MSGLSTKKDQHQEKTRVTEKKDGRRKGAKVMQKKQKKVMDEKHQVVQAMKIEEGDEKEGGKRVYVNYPTVQQYIFMSLRQKCIATVDICV